MSLHFFVCFVCELNCTRTIIESHHRYPSVTTKNRYASSPKLIFHSRGVFPDQCLN